MNLETPEAEIIRALERIVQMPAIKVEAYDDVAGQIRTWFYGGPADGLSLRLLDAHDRMRLTALSGAEIMRWHRAAAASKRVWQIRDREVTEWKAVQMVAATTPPPGVEPDDEEDPKGKKKPGWKAPPQWQVEAQYRACPEYSRLNTLVEQAEEAHSSCLGVIEAWQAVNRLLEKLHERG